MLYTTVYSIAYTQQYMLPADRTIYRYISKCLSVYCNIDSHVRFVVSSAAAISTSRLGDILVSSPASVFIHYFMVVCHSVNK